MNFKNLLLVTLLSGMASDALSADTEFNEENWTIEAQNWELIHKAGRDALMLHGGSARLKDAGLRDGIIEFDMLFENERGFSGGFWRWHDALNAEQFYIRPHQSGNSDANQYQPLFNGNASWQLYHGPEYAAPVTYRHGEWTRVKIIFSGRKAAFHIDSEEPVFVTGELKHEPASGGLGVYASGFAPAWFSNFSFQPLPAGYHFDIPEPGEAPPEHLVEKWDISTAFDWKSLDDLTELDPAHTRDLQWQSLAAEPTGITNISRILALSPAANTVFARLRIDSDHRQAVPLAFGYSDLARVFLNGRLLYQGHRIYQSRDYRYLGTMGLFDAVTLELQPGVNELLVAVGENFGGWGIMAQLAHDEGIRLAD
jgi:hypothetical protein